MFEFVTPQRNGSFRTVWQTKNCYVRIMVDWHAGKTAHKSEVCPVCKAAMPLEGDTYTCGDCGHFRQNPLLQTLVERDNPGNLRFCKCAYCTTERTNVPALDSI